LSTFFSSLNSEFRQVLAHFDIYRRKKGYGLTAIKKKEERMGDYELFKA